MPKEKQQKYFWKGRRVTEKVYNARINQQKAGQNVWNVRKTNTAGCHNLKTKTSKYIDLKDEGCKIVDMDTIANQLICKRCKSVLSLLDSTESVAIGLGTTYYIECRACGRTNEVLTDKQHSVSGSHKKIFNVNTKAVIGTLNGGGGCTKLNKVLSSLGVSPLNPTTYKTYEKEVGQVVEKMVRESCIKAAKEERELTIQKSEELKKLL